MKGNGNDKKNAIA